MVIKGVGSAQSVNNKLTMEILNIKNASNNTSIFNKIYKFG